MYMAVVEKSTNIIIMLKNFSPCEIIEEVNSYDITNKKNDH